jgi:hypothetical protein
MTEPAIQRVGGGRSARLSALVAVLLVAVVAWFGFIGREAGEPGGSLPPVAEASPSASPAPASPSPAAPTPSWRPTATPRLAPVTSFDGPLEDSYAIFMSIGQRPYFVTLRDRAANVLSADIRIPLPLAAPVATLNIVQLWSVYAESGLVPVLAVALPIEMLLDDSARIMIVPGRPAEEDSPRLIRDGYTLNIRGETRTRHAIMSVEVRVGGAATLPLAPDAAIPTLSEGFFEASLTRDLRRLTIVRLEGDSGGSFLGFVPLPAAWRSEAASLRIAWSDGRARSQRIVLADLALEPRLLGADGDPRLSGDVVRLERRIDGVRRWRYRVELQDLGPEIALLAIEVTPESALNSSVPTSEASEGDAMAVAPQPRLEARLLNAGRLTALAALGGAPPGVMTAHVIAHERDGPMPRLDLVMADGSLVQLLASHELAMAQLRRGYPDELVGEFTLEAGGEPATWRYRITPHATGLGVMLLVEAELVTAAPWTCWSEGEVC